MIPRYTLPEMGALWSEQARFERMLEVELAVCRAQARRGQVPADALAAIEAGARVDVERIAEIEKTTDHDVIAFVSQVAETVGPEGRYLHLGLTSSDVVDTALALQLRAAGERLLADADRLTAALVARARREAGTVMMGRTHSVHAEPTTFGLKCAGWAFEVARGRARLAEATAEIATGKISGPVGTYSHLGPDVEAEVLGELGLRVDPVSTQIVQRDRHAAFLAAIAILGGTLERLATEVRNLQHTEIGEVMEPFRRARRAARRCPTSATRSCPSGLPASLACCVGTRRPGSRTSRCGTSATSATAPRSGWRCPTPRSCSTTCWSARPASSRGSWSGRSACARTSSAASGCTPRRGCCSRSSSVAGSRARTPTRSSRAVRCARRTSACPCATCSRRTRRSPASCRSPTSTPASTTTRCWCTSPRSSPASTALEAARCGWLRSLVRAGKVRDLYRVGEDRLLLVASDRLSAFDVVLPTGIPDKGRVLTGLSRFWFAETASIVPNHLLSTDPADVPAEITDDDPDVVRMLRGRMMIGRLAEVLPIECVVRGYISGSGWKSYLDDGAICGIRLPFGVRESDRLPGSDLHARHQGAARRARREHLVRGHGDDRRSGSRGTRRALRPSPSTATARRSASGPGSSSPTRSSSSACCHRAS